ncbi:DUF4337 domain-containing protein [Polymorphobacter sp. PAMC 29334]|uniref:DUF4337 family protein n=1 Tax=Polymorphobacter sp. PAMC 29334 TaxID=2862331 RepID=UPI001C666A9E|nr:DUF4337 family protein [Polymorphobacter sp. PAMC 29334]QYE36620.1 DUF4337 domain-containing protein [Polymorphobacter sp. PAMC 29334]
MVEPADAKEMIDEAIERAETERSSVDSVERANERRFRDRVSLLVGVLAVSLAIVHMAAAGAARKSLLSGIAASDTFNYMQAKIIRETVVKAAAKSTAASDADRQAWVAEAARLRGPDKAGHGINQLEATGQRERQAGEQAATAGEGYELGETALQMAIVLLSIALVARSRPIVGGAVILAIAGIALAVMTAAGVTIL